MCGGDPWPTGTEPSLDELLSDPIAVALRRADRVTRRTVEAAIARARRALTRATPPGPARPDWQILPLRPARAHKAARPPASLEFDFDAAPELTLSE